MFENGRSSNRLVAFNIHAAYHVKQLFQHGINVCMRIEGVSVKLIGVSRQ